MTRSVRDTCLGWMSHIHPVSNPVWRRYHRARKFSGRTVYGKTGERAEIFSEIYHENLWGAAESRSGGGSTLLATRPIRRRLPAILASVHASTFLDAPCGDFNWMSRVDLGSIRYIGADIVSDMIGELQTRYTDDNHTFQVLDIVDEPAPNVDVWMCREVLMHLPTEDALKVLENFQRSGSRYFLSTSFDMTELNEDIDAVGFRALNLERPPIGLPRPLQSFDDFVAPMHPRIMGLWSREQVGAALGTLRP